MSTKRFRDDDPYAERDEFSEEFSNKKYNEQEKGALLTSNATLVQENCFHKSVNPRAPKHDNDDETDSINTQSTLGSIKSHSSGLTSKEGCSVSSNSEQHDKNDTKSASSNNDSTNRSTTDDGSASKASDAIDESHLFYSSIDYKIALTVQRWGRVAPIPPDQFLIKLLGSRGYENQLIPSSEYKRDPERKQLEDYDNDLVYAVRNSDIAKLKHLFSLGKSMCACNRFSESIVHIACRRSTFEVVEFLLANGGDCTIIDDYGRTPLHDACWRIEPRFDVVTLILDRNLTLLRMKDVRGSIPLNYVRQEHWLQWCAFFYSVKDKYWSMEDKL